MAIRILPPGHRRQEGRFRRAMLGAGDDKKLYGQGGALELTKAEYDKLVAHMNHTRRRDRQRRLLLIRIEAALENGRLISMTDDATVEHILPKSGGPGWDTDFPDPRRRATSANMLGNLALITHEQQILADNKSYAEKRKVYFETPGAPVHQLTQNLRPIPDWTAQVIEKRTYFLISELFNDWGLFHNEW